nr:reverse transcriptase domain-containing protein [Tanacetum cinerariifolium]
MANFIVERSEDDTPDTSIEDREELPDSWILFMDGSSCIDGSGAGLIITNPEGMEFTYALRGENKKAEALSKITSTSFAHLSKQVLVEELREKVIDEKEILVVVEEEGHTWMTLVYEYLTEGILLEKKKKARAVHCPVPRNPQEKLTPITSPWPFYKWGIDIAGPFPEGPCKVKFLILVMDYFTKWIEARPVATIKEPRDNPFKDWCEKLSIRQCFASVKHPQANDLVERANRSLGEGIKARLGKKIKTGWKRFTRLMGTSHHDQVKSWRNTILINLWSESNDPS